MTYLLADLWFFVFVLMLILALADAGYFNRGRHRGAYVEHEMWDIEHEVWDRNTILFGYPIVVPDYAQPEITTYITLQPRGGLLNIPCLVQEDDGGIGRFGDLTIDRADAPPLCLPMEDRDFGDEWRLTGTLDTVE